MAENSVFRQSIRAQIAAMNPTRILLPLLLALMALTGAVALRDASFLYHTPLTEDAYYSLAAARSFAAGHGFTIDGVLPTNGFQPLFTVLEAGCYWLAGGDEQGALRLVLILSWLIYGATGWLVGLLARDMIADGDDTIRQTRRWVASLLYYGGFLSFMHHFNGLETGLLLLAYATCWRAVQCGWLDRGIPGRLGMGVLLGLLVLTRIDAALFVVMFSVWLLWRDRNQGLVRLLLLAGLPGAVALAVSSPWWAYNYFEFGALMPTSGTAQQEWAVNERRLRWVFWALGVTGMPTLWVGRFDELFHDGLIPSLVRAMVALAALYGLVRAWRSRSPLVLAGSETQAARRSRNGLAFGAVLLATLALFCLYYGFSFIAYWFYYRYLFPFALPATVALAWLVAPVASRHLRASLAVLAMLALPMAISAAMATRGETLHVQTVYWEQLDLIKEMVPPDDAVAAGQAGTLGYFRKNIVNVDGKVNREVIAYQDRMWEELERRKVRWFCDWPFYVHKYLGENPAEHGWKQVGQKGYWQLWQRVD